MIKKKALLYFTILVTLLAIPFGGIVLAECDTVGNTTTCDGNGDENDTADTNLNPGENIENTVVIEEDANVTVVINTNEANDTVTVEGTDDGTSGGTARRISLGTGDDILNIEEGAEVRAPRGQEGEDTFNVDGTVGSRGINGGPGEDEINISETGVVNSNNEGVEGGDDPDVINNAGIITGTIYGDTMSDKGEDTDNDTINNSGTVGGIDSGAGDDEITNTGTVNGTINGLTGADRITHSGEANEIRGGGGRDTIDILPGATVTNVDAGANPDEVIVSVGSTVGTLDGGGSDFDRLVFRVFNDTDEETASEAEVGDRTIEFSDGTTFSWERFEFIDWLRVVLGVDDDDDEDVAPLSEPIKLYDDLTYLVVFLGETGLDFYRYDSPESLEGIGIGFVPYTDIAAADVPATLFDGTTEDGYRLVVSVLAEGQLTFELFDNIDGTTLVDATIAFQ